MVAATVASDLLQSYEMKRVGEHSVSARGLVRLLRTVARMIGPKCGSRSIWLTARTRRGVTRGPRRSGGGQMLPEELCNGRI